MPEEKEKKGFLEGWRKFLLGTGLIATGVVIGLKGDWVSGKYLVGIGIAVAIGGNIYDHERTNNKNKGER